MEPSLRELFSPMLDKTKISAPSWKLRPALRPINSRRRFRIRRKQITKRGVAPKLNARGRANLKSREQRARRRDKVSV